MDPFTHLSLGACIGELLLGKRFGKKAMVYGALAANVPDIDTCTSYGTGLLEPFGHHRFSFHLLFVVDPLFTLPLLIAACMLLIRKTGTISRRKWATGGITVAMLYVCLALFFKSRLDPKATLTTPAPFNTMLWYCIKKTDSGYYTGYQSVFDKRFPAYEFHAQNSALLKIEEPYLTKFADGYYTVSRDSGRLYFNVIRFGQIQGWQTKSASFVLSYPVGAQHNENMIIQKGRLAGWNNRPIRSYLERIAGR